MERIGIYGGSFDPPHKGHKLLAENLAEICSADRVIIIPTALSPFKDSSSATAQDRLCMCKLAFTEELFQVSDEEIKRGGKSYTIDTLREIKKQYPESQLFLFMGDDMFLSFNKWYKYKEISALCTVVCACRTKNLEKLDSMKAFAESVLGIGDEKVIVCEAVPFEISSTDIRSLPKNRTKEYLEKSVYDYIASRGLYE